MTLLQLAVPFVATSLTKVTVTAPPQLSVAVTAAMLGAGTAEKHWSVIAVGQVIEGGVVSMTVMVCAQVFMFPHGSVARYVRVMTLLQLDVPFVATSLTK